jgi:hypothetical protein
MNGRGETKLIFPSLADFYASWRDIAYPSMAQSGGLRDIPNAQLNVRYWPLADIPSCTAHVRFRW